MLFHLEFEKRFKRFLHHALKELLCVDGLRTTSRPQTIHQKLFVGLGIMCGMGNQTRLNGLCVVVGQLQSRAYRAYPQ
jgi:hypothetical protein